MTRPDAAGADACAVWCGPGGGIRADRRRWTERMRPRMVAVGSGPRSNGTPSDVIRQLRG